KPLRVVNDQTCSPTSSVTLAQILLQLIDSGAHGLFHGVNSGHCTWFGFAQEIFRLAGLQPSLTPIPSREYPTPARRPGYSVLSVDGLQVAGLSTPAPWQEALNVYLRQRSARNT
ncbi:MAG: SDR family oxidoreductase, partial [Gemmataceae bacterium]